MPVSITDTTWGFSNFAVVRASFRKRSAFPDETWSAFRIFSATCRSIEICSARYTLPVPPLAMWRMISYPATRVPAGSSFCRPSTERTSPQWMQVIFPCGSASDSMVHPQLLQIYSAMSSGLRTKRAYRIPLVDGIPFSFGSCDTACSSALARPLKTASKI